MRCATITVPMCHDALAFASEERVEVLYSTVPRWTFFVRALVVSVSANQGLSAWWWAMAVGDGLSLERRERREGVPVGRGLESRVTKGTALQRRPAFL